MENKFMVAEVKREISTKSALNDYDQKYRDALSFLISNSIAGEITATENYCRLVSILDDTNNKLEAVSQAHAEAKHIQILEKLAKRLDLPCVDRVVEPQWLEIRKYFDAALAKKNLAACYIVQDIMIEMIAISSYLGMSGIGETINMDPETSRTAEGLLQDELDHFELGISRLKDLLQQDSEDVHDALIWAHHRVMPEILNLARDGCTSLCGELGVVCGTFGAEDMGFENTTVRQEIIRRYTEALERIGFESKMLNSLMSGLSAYQSPKATTPKKAKTGSCC